MGGINAFGDASDVTVDNTGGTIVTAGDYAGVVAQSVGAGGCRIGSAGGQLTLGGDNASGDAGNVCRQQHRWHHRHFRRLLALLSDAIRRRRRGSRRPR